MPRSVDDLPVEPPDCPVPGLLEAVGVLVLGVDHVVQLHHDVRPDRSLDLDGALCEGDGSILGTPPNGECFPPGSRV